MSDEILTADQLAKRLKVKSGTVKIWARKGIIPAMRPTLKILRFNWAEVLAALGGINDDRPPT